MPPREWLLPALERVLDGGMSGEGEEVYALEREFASRFGLSNALAVSSGTAALHLAFLACGVRPGDEVITTAMTAEPTNTTILQMGARPVFADVEPDTRSEEHTSELQSLMRISYAVFCLKKKNTRHINTNNT